MDAPGHLKRNSAGVVADEAQAPAGGGGDLRLIGKDSRLVRLFLKIAEPRTIRVIQFFIYAGYIVAGLMTWIGAPGRLESVLGVLLLQLMGSFLTAGGLAGIVAVLPGIWWLERAGIVALVTALSVYLVAITTIGASAMGVVVALILIACMCKRWVEIRAYHVAPIE